MKAQLNSYADRSNAEIDTLKSQLTSSNAEIDTLKIQLNASNDRSDAEMYTLKNQLNSSAEENFAEIDTLKSHLTSLKKWSADKNCALKERLDWIEKNPVPENFTYVQLPWQKEPGELWPAVFWLDVTDKYEGCFFRALGGTSEGFGTVQHENAPRLTEVESVVVGEALGDVIKIPANGQLGYHVWSGNGETNAPEQKRALRFSVSEGEVRPRNMAVRIWQRVSQATQIVGQTTEPTAGTTTDPTTEPSAGPTVETVDPII